MLAQAARASMSLVHVLQGSAMDELYRWFGADAEVPRGMLRSAEERVSALAADLGRRLPTPIATRVEVGAVVEEIVKAADACEADLVVTGTRGTGFVRSHLIGPTAQRIVKRSGRPVLMVRQMPHEPYRRVLVPVDFSAWSAPALALARCVAPDALIVLLHVPIVPFEGQLRYAGVDDSTIGAYRRRARDSARAALEKLATDLALPGERWMAATPEAGDPWMEIVRQEQEYDCDLIVIGKHGRNALSELILGSTTQMVLAESAGDVLVYSGRPAAEGGAGAPPASAH